MQTKEAKEMSASLWGLLGVSEAARRKDVKQTGHLKAHTQEYRKKIKGL